MSQSPSNLLIRPFRLEDGVASAALLWAAFDANELLGSTRTDIQNWVDGIAGDPARTLVAVDDGKVVGLLTLPAEHVVVSDAYRRRGIGSHLVASAEALSNERNEAPLYLALPRDNPGARSFYRTIGWQFHHSLWSMRLDNEIAVALPSFPASVARRSFHVDDVPQLTEMINTIFLDHPTPLSVTTEQLTFVHTHPAFDSESLYLLVSVDAPDDLIAFCRVGFDRSDDDRKGWVPLIGVRREWRGHRLGRELLRWGIDYARQRGVSAVFLAVESDNERALRIYESIGFRRVEEWPRYGRPANS